MKVDCRRASTIQGCSQAGLTIDGGVPDLGDKGAHIKVRGHEVVSTPLDGILGILRLVRFCIALRHKIKPGLQQTKQSCKGLAPAESQGDR